MAALPPPVAGPLLTGVGTTSLRPDHKLFFLKYKGRCWWLGLEGVPPFLARVFRCRGNRATRSVKIRSKLFVDNVFKTLSSSS